MKKTKHKQNRSFESSSNCKNNFDNEMARPTIYQDVKMNK